MTLRTSAALGATKGQLLGLLLLAAATVLLAPLVALPGLCVASALLLARLPRIALAALGAALLLALLGVSVPDSHRPAHHATTRSAT